MAKALRISPKHDLQGVWMRRTLKDVFGSGATYTKDLPEMTPRGQEKFKEAKDSNGGAYTLDLPKDLDPLWLGYSVGHWEGDTTFVVDTAGFNEKIWLDRLGVPHSDQLVSVDRRTS